MLDACALIRLHKCEVLLCLEQLAELHVAGQVHSEFTKGGPSQRALLAELSVIRHPVHPGLAAEWDAFCKIRGSENSTTDLGEAESIATCLAQAKRGRLLPLVTFDMGAAKQALRQGIPVVDFLGLLSWRVACGALSYEEAGGLEKLAAQRNGWKPPPHYAGQLELVAPQLRAGVAHSIQEWRIRLRGGKRTRK